MPPEGRERIENFLRLHRSACRAFDEMRPDLFVHRLIERIGLRKQHLFNTSSESLERLVNIAKFADLAAAWVRRAPGRTLARLRRVRDAPCRPPGCARRRRSCTGTRSAVQVMTMHGAKGLEFDCVYVLGVQQSRMPGRRRSSELVPDALLKEELPGHEHRGARRRDAAPAVRRDDARPQAARARRGRRSAGTGDQTEQKPSAVLRGGARRGRRRGGGAQRGAARHPRGPVRRVPHAARRGDGRRRAGRRAHGRDAPRRAPRRGRPRWRATWSC